MWVDYKVNLHTWVFSVFFPARRTQPVCLGCFEHIAAASRGHLTRWCHSWVWADPSELWTSAGPVGKLEAATQRFPSSPPPKDNTHMILQHTRQHCVSKQYWWLCKNENSSVCVNLFFNHELVTLHHELKFVPFCSQSADGVQTSTCHGPQEFVLVFRLLELRQYLNTTFTY